MFKSRFIYQVHGLIKNEYFDVDSNRYIGHWKDLLLEKLLFKLCDFFILPSELLYEMSTKEYQLKKSKCAVIPHGVEMVNQIHKKTLSRDQKLNIVLYNGIANYINRELDFILSMLESMREENFTVYIIGNRYAKKGLSFEIKIVSPMEENDLFKFLEDKHIYIGSPIFSSFSLMALECMAAGLVVIISKQTGLSSLVTNGYNGFVYENMDSNKIIDCIQELHKKRDKFLEISCNARLSAQDFSWKNSFKQYIKAYKSLSR
jgi:1,2-diacylglycerol 3-alpha-glucosyltransferase